MIDLAPFSSQEEHLIYCQEANVNYEEGAIGFKIYSDDLKVGMVQLKFVGEAAYVLAVCAIENRISTQLLANVFLSIVQFMEHLGVSSVVYPIQTEADREIAQGVGFDEVSPTLFVFDFPDALNDDAADLCNCESHHDISCHGEECNHRH